MKKEGKGYSSSDLEIPLSLNDYADIFSDLDPRPYSHKALSGDFLEECKKASFDKKNINELNLFIPRAKRNLLSENKIKERLKDHFNKHFLEKKKEMQRIKQNGLSWFIVGCIIIVLTAVFVQDNASVFMKILINISHPAGWFFLWEGLAKILLFSKEKKAEYLFYKKMSFCKINFFSW